MIYDDICISLYFEKIMALRNDASRNYHRKLNMKAHATLVLLSESCPNVM
jgi:hypothetical protein